MIGAVVEAGILQVVREIISVRTGEPLSIGSHPEMDSGSIPNRAAAFSMS